MTVLGLSSAADRERVVNYDRVVSKTVMRRRRNNVRTRILIFLDEPRSSAQAGLVFVITVVLILISVATVFVDSTVSRDEDTPGAVVVLEWICSIAFSFEVLLRILCLDSVMSCASDIFMWIDITAVLPFFIDIVFLLTPADEEVTLDFLRLMRLLRLLKLARHYESSRVLLITMRNSAEGLLVPLFFLMMGVVLFAGVLYYAERGGVNEDKFANMFDASWFVIVTLGTVGYGDVVPATDVGKAVTVLAIVCGVLFMAMPITIVGNSFARVWEEKEAIKVVLKMQELLLMRNLQAKDVLHVFTEFDRDGDGSLDIQEFKLALSIMGVTLTPDRMRKLFAYFDQDHNNMVDCLEFCNVIFPTMAEEDFDLSVMSQPTWSRPNTYNDDDEGEEGEEGSDGPDGSGPNGEGDGVAEEARVSPCEYVAYLSEPERRKRLEDLSRGKQRSSDDLVSSSALMVVPPLGAAAGGARPDAFGTAPGQDAAGGSATPSFRTRGSVVGFLSNVGKSGSGFGGSCKNVLAAAARRSAAVDQAPADSPTKSDGGDAAAAPATAPERGSVAGQQTGQQAGQQMKETARRVAEMMRPTRRGSSGGGGGGGGDDGYQQLEQRLERGLNRIEERMRTHISKVEQRLDRELDTIKRDVSAQLELTRGISARLGATNTNRIIGNNNRATCKAAEGNVAVPGSARGERSERHPSHQGDGGEP